MRPDEETRSRKNRPSDRLAEPQTQATRVRFNFARHAHQREITPKLGINPAERRSQEERGEWKKKVASEGEKGLGAATSRFGAQGFVLGDKTRWLRSFGDPRRIASG